MNDDICNFWIHPSLFKRPVILKLQTPEIADSVAILFFLFGGEILVSGFCRKVMTSYHESSQKEFFGCTTS